MKKMATYLKPEGEYQPRKPMATRPNNYILWAIGIVMLLDILWWVL